MKMNASKFGGAPDGIGFRRARQRAFTLLEVLLAGALLTILATIAMASYNKFTDRARNAEAAADIREIESAITRFYTQRSRNPVDLAEVGISKSDPWGSPYQFLDFSAQEDDSRKRKDRNVQPINSDFDLYSNGKDKATIKRIDTGTGADDIVRGRNGRYIGLGKDYH